MNGEKREVIKFFEDIEFFFNVFAEKKTEKEIKVLEKVLFSLFN